MKSFCVLRAAVASLVFAFAQPAAFAAPLTIDYYAPSGQPEQISSFKLLMNPLAMGGEFVHLDANGIARGVQDYPLGIPGHFELTTHAGHVSGHIVLPGDTMTFVTSAGERLPVGVVVPSVVSEDQFQYKVELSLDPSVKMAVTDRQVGPVIHSYYRNALSMCMRQDVRSITLIEQYTIGNQVFTTKSVDNESVGPEMPAPFMCPSNRNGKERLE